MRRTMAGTRGLVRLVAGVALIAAVPLAHAQPRGASSLVEVYAEDLESFATGTSGNDVPGWSNAVGVTIEDQSLVSASLGVRSATVDLHGSSGLFLLASIQPEFLYRPSIVSIDVVPSGLSANDNIRIAMQDLIVGVNNTAVVLESDGDILYVDEAMGGGGQTMLVDTGVDFVQGAVVNVEFEQTIGGEILIRIDGDLVAVAPNFGAIIGDLVGFTNVLITTNTDDVAGGSLIFDNISFDQINLVGIACPTDLDGDGDTDSNDLAILLGAWGVCP